MAPMKYCCIVPRSCISVHDLPFDTTQLTGALALFKRRSESHGTTGLRKSTRNKMDLIPAFDSKIFDGMSHADLCILDRRANIMIVSI